MHSNNHKQELRGIMRARTRYLKKYAQQQDEQQDEAQQPHAYKSLSQSSRAHDPADAVYNMSRQLLKGSEHTWGIHVQS